MGDKNKGLGKQVLGKMILLDSSELWLYFHYRKKRFSKLVMAQEMLYYDTDTQKFYVCQHPCTEWAAPSMFHDSPLHDPRYSSQQGLFLYRWKWKWSPYVLSNSLWSHGLWRARLLYPWNFPGRSTGVGCHFFFQGIFMTQGSNPSLLHCGKMLYGLSHQGKFSIGVLHNI